MKQERRKIAKGNVLFSCCLFLLLSACSGLSSPSEKEAIIPDEIVIPEGKNQEEKLSNSLDSIEGLEGSFSFSLSYPDKDDSSKSNLSSDNLSLRIAKGENNPSFHLSGDLLYNGVSESLYANLDDETFYLSVLDLKYKYSLSTYEDMIGKIISIFGVDGVKVPSAFYDLLDPLFNSSSSSTELDYVYKGLDGSYQLYTLESSSFDGQIEIRCDESYNLHSISTDGIWISSAYLSFNATIDINNEEASIIKGLVPSDAASYVEAYDSMGLVKRIYSLIGKSYFSLNLDGSIHHISEKTSKHEQVDEDISFEGNLDFNMGDAVYAANVSFADASLGGDNWVKAYSDKTDDQNLYVNYNDALKFAAKGTLIDELFARVKEDYGEMDLMDQLIKIIDNANLKDISNGRYESILNCLADISHDANNINITLDMASFGFGDESTMSIAITDDESASLISVYLDKVGLDNFYFVDTSITLGSYVDPIFDTTGYYFLEKLPTIYSQINSLVNSPKACLDIEGSYMDENEVGLTSFTAKVDMLGEVDDNQKYTLEKAALNIDLIQRLGVNNDDGSFKEHGDSKNHHIDMELDGVEEAYFHYYDNGAVDSKKKDTGTYGKLKISAFSNIVEIIMDIYNSDDERFAKWFKVVGEVAASNVMDALTYGTFGPLLAANLIKSSSFTADKAIIVLSGKAFGFNSDSSSNDFTVTATYENDEIHTLSVSKLYIGGSYLNVTATIGEYQEDSISILDRSQSYFDLTGLSPLISAVYNCAKMKTYHLTSDDLKVKFLTDATSVSLKMDYYIFVDGSIVKVYGKISVTRSQLINTNSGGYKVNESTNWWPKYVTYGYRNTIMYFDDVDPSTGKAYEDNSGFLYLSVKNAKTANDFTEDSKTTRYKYHSDWLKNTSNLVEMLVQTIIDLNDLYYNQIANAVTDTSDAGTAIDYENVLTNFVYDESSKKWDISVDLGVLANTSMLSDLDVSLYGGTDYNGDESLSKATIKTKMVANMITATATFNNAGLKSSDNWSGVSSSYESYIKAHKNDTATYA